MANIPELTQHQYAILTQTAKSDTPIFAVPLPLASDNAATRYKLMTERMDAALLVHLDLAEDVSEEFAGSIRTNEERTGRRIKVYGLTETSYLMFAELPTTRPIN